MAEIKPFKGLLYNLKKTGEPSKLFCPPYDVITPEEQTYFHQVSPYNIIRVELGKHHPDDSDTNNVYTRANQTLNNWIEENILTLHNEPGFYLYLQTFRHGKKEYNRPGIIAAVKIEDYEKKVILPHEKTLPKAKKDRFKLLSETKTNISQIFGFFSDTTRKARITISETAKQKPLFKFKDNQNILHSLFKIPASMEESLLKALQDERIFIADGHHRYETALDYRNKMREKHGFKSDAPWEYVMMTLVPIESDLLILPIHRIVLNNRYSKDSVLIDKLSKYFEVFPVCGSNYLLNKVNGSGEKGVLGMVTHSGSYVLKARNNSLEEIPDNRLKEIRFLDANILFYLVLKPVFIIDESNFESDIYFTSNTRSIIEIPKKEKERLGFLLRPVSVEVVKKAALSLTPMPQKTTYFYPKIWTGLVMRRI